jgi:hypothetical protein
MLLDATLGKDDGLLGVQADSEQAGEHLTAPCCQLVGILADGDGVQVDNGEEQRGIGGRVVLQLHPLAQGAEIVAEMGDARGLDAREDDGRMVVIVCCN